MTTELINKKIRLEEMNPPADLKIKVLKRVEATLEQKNKNRRIIGLSLFSVSFLSCIYFMVNLIQEFQRSGFSTYLSLAFSDSKIVLANFGEFALSLADSLPFFAITITLISLLVILISIQYATNSKKELSYIFS